MSPCKPHCVFRMQLLENNPGTMTKLFLTDTAAQSLPSPIQSWKPGVISWIWPCWPSLDCWVLVPSELSFMGLLCKYIGLYPTPWWILWSQSWASSISWSIQRLVVCLHKSSYSSIFCVGWWFFSTSSSHYLTSSSLQLRAVTTHILMKRL